MALRADATCLPGPRIFVDTQGIRGGRSASPDDHADLRADYNGRLGDDAGPQRAGDDRDIAAAGFIGDLLLGPPVEMLRDELRGGLGESSQGSIQLLEAFDLDLHSTGHSASHYPRYSTVWSC